MGLEIINQPQVFTQGITALGGIQGITEKYPLLTSYYSWTSTANVSSDIFPIPYELGNMLEDSESFIVSVGGVLQPPSTYTIDVINRTLIFSTPVSADIEIAVTQLATASPSSQNFDYVKSVSADFTRINCVSAVIDDLIIGSSFEPPNLYLPTGELGIGLINADTKLHIKAAENDQLTISNAAATSNWRLNVSDINNNFAIYDFDNTATPVSIEKNAPTASIYAGVIGVGIGTNTPNEKLTIVGNVSATGRAFTNSIQTTNLAVSGNINVVGSIGIGTDTPESRFTVFNDRATFAANQNQLAIAAKFVATGGAVYFGATNDTSTPNAVISNSLSAALATFTHGGAVGIGTTTPSTYKLDVFANGNTLGGIRSLNQNGGSSAFTIYQIGNDTNNTAGGMRLNSSTNTGGIGGANAMSIIQGLNAPLVLATNNTERVRIDASGNATFQGDIITLGDIRGTGALEIVSLTSNYIGLTGTGTTYTASPIISSYFPVTFHIPLTSNRSYEIEYNLYYRVFNSGTDVNRFRFSLSANDNFAHGIGSVSYNYFDGSADLANTFNGALTSNFNLLAFGENSVNIARNRNVYTRIQAILTTGTVPITVALGVQARGNAAAERSAIVPYRGSSRRYKWIQSR